MELDKVIIKVCTIFLNKMTRQDIRSLLNDYINYHFKNNNIDVADLILMKQSASSYIESSVEPPIEFCNGESQ